MWQMFVPNREFSKSANFRVLLKFTLDRKCHGNENLEMFNIK